MHKGRFENLQARLSKKLMDCGYDWMSQSARAIFIQVVAQAIPTYIMGVFKLPFSICDELTKLIREYWWGVEHGKRKTHWVSWDKMIRTKSQGGRGFRDMRIFNQALLARQAWRLLAFPNSLCARVLKAKYYPHGDLIDTVFTGNPSSTWTAITHGLELLKKVWYGGSETEQKLECGGIAGSREFHMAKFCRRGEGVVYVGFLNFLKETGPRKRRSCVPPFCRWMRTQS
jgi:hypothetical protein